MIYIGHLQLDQILICVQFDDCETGVYCWSELLSFHPIIALNVPIWFDSSNAWHRSIDHHPEQPARIDACGKKIRSNAGRRPSNWKVPN
jgi:hypothetical protein